MAVLTLIQREERLVEFLRATLPGYRVVASLQGRAEAAARGSVNLPEVRVLPAAPGSGGVLRWRIELANGDSSGDDRRRIGPRGLLVAAQQIRDALAAGTHPWRSVEAFTASERGGVDTLTEHLEEAWTPGGRMPQRLFVFAVSYGIVVAPTIPAGTREFSIINGPLTAPPVGSDAIVYRDAEDAEYLGPVTSAGPPLRTELGTLRARADGLVVYTANTGVAAAEAGVEQESFDADDWRHLEVGVAGHRRQKVIAGARSRLVVHFPAMPLGGVREWLAFLAAHRDRVTMLLARSDRSLAEVSLLAAESTQPADGQAGSLKLTFLSRPLASLAGFDEVQP